MRVTRETVRGRGTDTPVDWRPAFRQIHFRGKYDLSLHLSLQRVRMCLLDDPAVQAPRSLLVAATELSKGKKIRWQLRQERRLTRTVHDCPRAVWQVGKGGAGTDREGGVSLRPAGSKVDSPASPISPSLTFL